MNSWSLLKELPPVADVDVAEYAVMVPLYEDSEGDLRVVLTRRPDHMPTHPSDIVFPGGRREEGEGPVETAVREAHEEIGLPRENILEVLGGLTPVTTRNRDEPIVPVVVRFLRPDVFVADPGEVDVIIEPMVAELMEESAWETRDWMGYDLWFFEFPEGTLWGATALMMRELIGYLDR